MFNLRDSCFQNHVHFLRNHLIWPKDTSKPVGVYDFLYSSLVYGLLSLLSLSPFFTHLYKAYISGIADDADISSDVLILAEGTFFTYTYLMFLWKANDVISIIEELKSYEKFGEPRNLRKLIKKQNKHMKILYAYTFIGGLAYGLITYFIYNECEQKNIAHGTKIPCSFIFPIWLPPDIIKNVYVIWSIFLLQTIFILLILLPAIVTTHFGASIAEHITVRVIHLREMLEELSSLPTHRAKKEKLIYCVKYHMYILRLTDKLHSSTGPLNAVHFFLSSLVIGILNYRTLRDFSLREAIHLNGWVFSLIILCQTGQEVITESTTLSVQIYSIKWYEMDLNLRKVISLTLLRMQTPLKISAGIFYSYSYELLLAIAQASYTYATVLNQFVQRTHNV